MNKFHRFQNLQLFSNLLIFVFANLIEKAIHVILFWNLSRNPDKISSKTTRKCKFDAENEKWKFICHLRKNVDDFWLKF